MLWGCFVAAWSGILVKTDYIINLISTRILQPKAWLPLPGGTDFIYSIVPFEFSKCVWKSTENYFAHAY